MKNVTIWIKPTTDGNYKRVVQVENAAGTYIENEEEIPATERLQKILEEAEKKNLSHDDGSYIASDIRSALGYDMDLECRKAVEQEGE